MTLQVLRNQVGDRDFFRILGAWAARKAGGNGTTSQFIALAERISGEQLDELFDAWLFTAGKPTFAVASATGTTTAATAAAEPPGPRRRRPACLSACRRECYTRGGNRDAARLPGWGESTLLWDGLPALCDGLPAHRSTAMRAWLRSQRSWLWSAPVRRCDRTEPGRALSSLVECQLTPDPPRLPNSASPVTADTIGNSFLGSWPVVS